MGQLTYSTADIQYLLNIVKDKFVFLTAGTGNTGQTYTIFARTQKNTTGNIRNTAFLVSNLGQGTSTSAKRGLYLLSTYNRSSAFTLHVTALEASTGTVTFGYYEDGDYIYIGVYRGGTYGAAPSIIALYNANVAPVEFGDFGVTTTQPTGWTAAES